MEQLSLNSLKNFLGNQGVELSEKQFLQLEGFASMLYTYSGRMSLVSAADRDNLVRRHFLECFFYVKNLLMVFPSQARLVDMGTGGGLPGVILSIIFPENDIVLLESVRKKSLFLKKVKEELSLSYTVVNERIERVESRFFKSFDVVTARALAALPLLMRYAFPLLREGGQLHVIKGRDYEQEMAGLSGYALRVVEPGKEWRALGDYLAYRKYLIIGKNDEDGI